MADRAPSAAAQPLETGDRGQPAGRSTTLRVGGELLLLWLVVLLGIRLVVTLQEALGLHEALLALVPFLFIYGPVALCRARRVDSYGYRLYVPAFRDLMAWGAALRINLRLVATFLLPWLLAYHLYQTVLFHHHPSWVNLLSYARHADAADWLGRQVGAGAVGPGAVVAAHVIVLVAYHLFFVAIPEEFFYRGYVQTRLNEVFPRRFLLAGVPFGHALWITALFFAFGHSLVEFHWWHFATFFPGLAFGLMRERTGGVIAGAFLHATCNVMVHLQDATYGVIAPP
ncbi:MAG: CPBP family intramembrane glutamic endopeptidase [Pseudomonadota bacterium]